MSESLDELKSTIEALETGLAEARERLRESASALDRLNEARDEAEGQLSLARRAVEDYEARLDARRAEVAEAVRAAAASAYTAAVAERDAAVSQVADTIRALLAAFEALDAARAAVVSAETEARRAGANLPRAAPSEPPLPEEEWERLHAVLGATSQARLDEELIAAAVAKPHTIGELPAHLQPVAYRRRKEAFRRRA